MDPTKLLEADHRQVEDLLEQIENAEPEARRPLIDELVTSLRGHMELEEQVVYPAMEPITGAEEVQEGINEHDLVREGIESLVGMGPDEPGFAAALDMVKAGIQHHVEDEEGEVFPQLRKEGKEQLAAMEQPFLAKRTELGLPMDPEMIAEVSTKEELLEAAKAAGVSGAASMTKTELAKAVVEGR